MNNKNIRWLPLLMLLILVLAACAGADEEKAEGIEQSSETRSQVEPESERPPASLVADKAEAEVLEEVDEEGIDVEEKVTEEMAEATDEEVEKIDQASILRDASVRFSEAPAELRVRFETTKGDFVVKLIRNWSPKGVDHFYHLVKIGYYQDIAFFRAIQGFMVQFGIHGDPEINAIWADANIDDDPVRASNRRGYLTYAKSSLPNSRSTQLYINLVDNLALDSMGFSPIGEVVEGMSVVDSLYTGYGEGAPRGRGPSQQAFSEQGNELLKRQFPELDYLKRAVLLD